MVQLPRQTFSFRKAAAQKRLGINDTGQTTENK